MSQYKTDITIIGAGPIGLFTIFQAGMLNMKCHIVDNLGFIGGQCAALYPEKPIYDIPAHPMITGQGLIDNLEAQSSPFKPHYHLNQQITKFHLDNDNIIVTTSGGTIIESKALIIAAGCGAFGPNRPPINNIMSYENKSVFYSVTKRANFAGKKILIAGGGDSAVDWALNLVDIADKIYLIHRRANFKSAPENALRLKKLAEEKIIEILTPYQLFDIEGENGQIRKVIIKDLNNNSKILEVDNLLAFFGLSMELGPLANWGLNIEKKHILVDPITFRTNIPNIYAIGDIAHYPGKLKLILNGFGEASMACHNIYNIVYPNKPLHFEYSTTKGIDNSNFKEG